MVVTGCVGTIGWVCPELIGGYAILDEAVVAESIAATSEEDAAVAEALEGDAEALATLERDWPAGEASNCESRAAQIQDMIGGEVRTTTPEVGVRLRPASTQSPCGLVQPRCCCQEWLGLRRLHGPRGHAN